MASTQAMPMNKMTVELTVDAGVSAGVSASAVAGGGPRDTTTAGGLRGFERDLLRSVGRHEIGILIQ